MELTYPKSWADVPFKNYLRYLAVSQAEASMEVRYAAILGTNSHELRQMPNAFVAEAAHAITAFLTEPPADVRTEMVVGDLTLRVPDDFGDLPFGAVVDMDEHRSQHPEDILEQIPVLLAIATYVGEYTLDKIKERTELIANAPTSEAWPLANFISAGRKTSPLASRLSMELNIQTQISQAMERLERDRALAGTLSFSKRSVAATFYDSAKRRLLKLAASLPTSATS